MAEAKRLVIFGDSIAKGVMFQDGRYHLCRAHDFDALAQQGVEVLNFAKMGACTDTGLAIAKKQLEFGPEDAGRIQKQQPAVHIHPLLAARHAGAVFRLCALASGNLVDKGRLSDVRNTDDHEL